jgi:hypothetical protein
LTFVFLLKRRRFDLKKLTRATRWPGQNPEPGPWTGPATGPGLKTMLCTVALSYFQQAFVFPCFVSYFSIFNFYSGELPIMYKEVLKGKD